MSTGQPFRKPFLANSDLLLGTEIVSPLQNYKEKELARRILPSLCGERNGPV